MAPGEIALVPLGIASEFPSGYFVSVRDRSGLAARHGLHALAGVIDAGYRGEWKVVLANLGSEPVRLEAGQAIAQGILQPVEEARIVEAETLSASRRAEGGFGSTD